MGQRGQKTDRSTEGVFVASLLLLTAILSVVVGLRHWLPPLASEHGGGIDLMINYLLITTGLIFLVGHGVLAYFVWKSSCRERVALKLPTPKAERTWSLIPVIVMTIIAEGGVLVLGLPVWGKYYASGPPADAMTIEVTGEQFMWQIRYPGPDGKFGRYDPHLISDSNPLGLDFNDPTSADDIVQPGEIFMPVNKPIRIRLRSKDTLHSFFLPHLRVKQDAVPGMNIEIWFVPTQIGDFELACAEVCGLGHYQMRGVVKVRSQSKFDQWLSEQ